ncbi:hypothetical protein TNCV_4519121 [Trichonephila clavipes]|nr:hypothetical protein TNCV_4519121 [Trichonephila clavipes]
MVKSVRAALAAESAAVSTNSASLQSHKLLYWPLNLLHREDMQITRDGLYRNYFFNHHGISLGPEWQFFLTNPRFERGYADKVSYILERQYSRGALGEAQSAK